MYRIEGSDAGVEVIAHLETFRSAVDDGARPALVRIMDGFRAMTVTELACHHPVADGARVSLFPLLVLLISSHRTDASSRWMGVLVVHD